MMFGHGETVTVTRIGAVTSGFDEAGDPHRAAPTTFNVTNVGVAPLTSEESMELFGDVAENGYTLYLPYGTELLASDRVTVRGVSGWQVDGDARTVDWRSPFTGWEPGTVAVVRRAS